MKWRGKTENTGIKLKVPVKKGHPGYKTQGFLRKTQGFTYVMPTVVLMAASKKSELLLQRC